MAVFSIYVFAFTDSFCLDTHEWYLVSTQLSMLAFRSQVAPHTQSELRRAVEGAIVTAWLTWKCDVLRTTMAHACMGAKAV